jgi:hypothetical protein
MKASNDQSLNSSDSRLDSEVFADLVEKAMKRAVKRAIEEHHRAGHPVSIWRDGRIVRLYSDGSVQPVPSSEPAEGG